MTTDTPRALQVETELVASLEKIRAALPTDPHVDVVLSAPALRAVLDAMLLLLEEYMGRYFIYSDARQDKEVQS